MALFASLATAGQIFFSGQSDCAGDVSNQSPGPEGVDCRQLGGINSAKATQIDDGCSCKYVSLFACFSLLIIWTVTVYTDSNCSDNPTAAGLGQCITGAVLNSFSYDC